jgi:hypothetical protein
LTGAAVDLTMISPLRKRGRVSPFYKMKSAGLFVGELEEKADRPLVPAENE